MTQFPKVYALQTVRGGSKSVKNKNMLEIGGIPIYFHVFMAAKNCKDICKTYITTNLDPIIKDKCTKGHVIQRPSHLCTDESSHYDTIMHGLGEIEQRQQEQVDYLVILLGNSMGAEDPRDLSSAINALVNNPEYDSCMSVSPYNMFNPYRAYKINDKNSLTTMIPQRIIKKENTTKAKNDKNAFGNTYFFNGGFWICKREALVKNNGLLPFTWLGKKILPYVQDEGVMEIDASWQVEVVCG